MAFPKQWAARVALTAVLLGGAGCSSSPEKSESKPTVPPTSSASVAGAQNAGPQAASSEALGGMVQEVVTGLNQVTTGPGGQPQAMDREQMRALLQSQMDQLIKRAQNNP